MLFSYPIILKPNYHENNPEKKTKIQTTSVHKYLSHFDHITPACIYFTNPDCGYKNVLNATKLETMLLL